MNLTDEQWTRLLIPYYQDDQTVVAGPGETTEKSSMASSSAQEHPWHDLPGSYPPYQICHRPYRNRVREKERP